MVPTYDGVHEEAVPILSCPTIWDGQALFVVSFVFFDLVDGNTIPNPSTTLYIKTDLPTDPLLAVHTRKNALSPAPDHDPRRVIVFTCKITHQKLMPNG
jgi:hypothetical protein